MGTEEGNQCGHAGNGDCNCRIGATGTLCDECDDGFWGFGETDEIELPCRSKFFWNELHITYRLSHLSFSKHLASISWD